MKMWTIDLLKPKNNDNFVTLKIKWIMNNYYNTTNNYFTSPGIVTSTVIYDKQRLALLRGRIYSVGGMLLVTSFENKKDDKGPSINTYRQLLLDDTLRPGGIIYPTEEYCFMFLPEDGVLDEKTLKDIGQKVWSAGDNSMMGLVDEFNECGIRFQSQSKQMEVHLMFYEDGAFLSISSDAFCLDIEDVDRDEIKKLSPADFLDVLELHNFTGLEFKFVSDNENDKDIEALAAQLNKWMAIHTEGGLLYDANELDNCNDGEYTYTKSLGKIRMTREEFLEKFPDANKF